MNHEPNEAKDIENMKNMIESLSDYFTLQPFNSYFARLEVKQSIPVNAKGTLFVNPGHYFMDADSKLYHAEETRANEEQGDSLPINTRKIAPFLLNGNHLLIANLIFYIGEFMTMPTVANEYFDNYFPKGIDHITADLQNIVIPKEVVAPIDRVTRKYFANKLKPNYEVTVKINEKGSTITVVNSEGKKEERLLASKVTISLLELPPGIEISREPTLFDNNVFVAVCSLYDSGNIHFTGHDIYRAMIFNPDAKATEDMLQLIDDSWFRLTSTAMRLDTGTMGYAYGFAQYIRDRRIIEGGRDKAIITNQHGHFEVVVYSIFEKPTLLEYADMLNQISRFPAIEQNTPVNKSREMLVIQNKILEHIHAIDRPNMSNHILYEPLYEYLDTAGMKESSVKVKKKRAREQIHKMLDYWKKIGVFKSWQDIKKGNSFYAMDIKK